MRRARVLADFLTAVGAILIVGATAVWLGYAPAAIALGVLLFVFGKVRADG